NNQANPIGKSHQRLAKRLLQMAELEVRVSIHQTRNQSDVAQVLDRVAGSILVDTGDLVARNLKHAIAQRRLVDRENPASAKRLHSRRHHRYFTGRSTTCRKSITAALALV